MGNALHEIAGGNFSDTLPLDWAAAGDERVTGIQCMEDTVITHLVEESVNGIETDRDLELNMIVGGDILAAGTFVKFRGLGAKELTTTAIVNAFF